MLLKKIIECLLSLNFLSVHLSEFFSNYVLKVHFFVWKAWHQRPIFYNFYPLVSLSILLSVHASVRSPFNFHSNCPIINVIFYLKGMISENCNLYFLSMCLYVRLHGEKWHFQIWVNLCFHLEVKHFVSNLSNMTTQCFQFWNTRVFSF